MMLPFDLRALRVFLAVADQGGFGAAARELHITQAAVSQSIANLVQGEVRIGIHSMLGSFYFPPLLMGFKAQHSGIRLTVVEAGARYLQPRIASGELDLGVVIDDGASRHLVKRHLTREAMVVCVPRKHPFVDFVIAHR